MNPVEAAAARLLTPDSGPPVDFTKPPGEPALVGPDSVSWRVFKNPISLFIGGVTAVILEFAEPRVRSGVWDNSTFRTDPLGRLKRTGLAAMVTVYGGRSTAVSMIARVGRLHAGVAGETPAGARYQATDPELLTWVQATAAFGFLEAYDAYVRPLSAADKDRYYAEGGAAAALYGARGAPRSRADQDALFQAMRPKLEASPIVLEFLDIMARRALLPAPLRSLQSVLVRAAVEITPGWAREILGLGPAWRLRPWETATARLTARLADRARFNAHPAAQACQRLGLPANYLWTRGAASD